MPTSLRARVLAVVAALLAVAVAGLGWTFVRRPLPVPAEDLTRLPRVPGVAGVGLSVVPTASIDTQHGFSVRGASLLAPLTSAMVAVVVHHPRGPLLIDAGMGREGVAHLATTPRLMQTIVELDVTRGTADALRQGGVSPGDLVGVLLTHSHWDHVSGLQDLPDLPVWMTPEEQVYAVDDPGALLYRQLDAARPVDLHTLELTGGPYGPFARSLDFFGDGSVVVVPMPGHTPGSVGVLVNLPSGRRFLFIGDTAWAREGVDWPAEKPWLSRRMVDGDAAGVRQQLVQLHRLQRAHPELVVVPAHDARVHATVATLPERER